MWWSKWSPLLAVEPTYPYTPKINDLAWYASLHLTLTHVQPFSGYEALSRHYQKFRSQLSHANTIYDLHVWESQNSPTRNRTQLTPRDKTTTGRILRLARDKTCHLQSLNVFWHLTYELSPKRGTSLGSMFYNNHTDKLRRHSHEKTISILTGVINV